MAAQNRRRNNGKRCKRPDNRPARLRYYNSDRLATRKCANLIRSGYSVKDAIRVWTEARKRPYGKGPNIRTLTKIAG